MLQHISSFFSSMVTKGAMEAYLYNEYALQFELGMFLQDSFGENYKVQVESSLSRFINVNTHRADIVVFSPPKPRAGHYSEFYAIELKFPRNGQYPYQMYQFIKDIEHMENFKSELMNAGKCVDVHTFVLALVDDHNFYTENKHKNSIYKYFRRDTNVAISKSAVIPNGKATINIRGKYTVNWIDTGYSNTNVHQGDMWKYYCFECQ